MVNEARRHKCCQTMNLAFGTLNFNFRIVLASCFSVTLPCIQVGSATDKDTEVLRSHSIA